ncbi:MAG: hypothetical protein IK118_02435 [Clostridia bacterium]|nr:hypothetical protein [Clostridia bacterium]
MKKIKISSEVDYILAILLISFSVAMATCADLGISMIVAPAYILSQKLTFLTFGQAEYVVQGVLIVLFCILMRKVKLVYFSSFLTGLVYGAALDLWRLVIPHFNPDITPPGSLPMALRIVYFILSMLMTSLSIAMFFRTYFYPQVYDFFVKGVSEKFGLDRNKFKICYDAAFLLISCAMTLLLFHSFVGVGVGTLVLTACNGVLIGLFGKMLDRFFVFEPRFKKLAGYFDIT